MTKHNPDLEHIASVVHGVQAFAYVLGLVYHIKKKNRVESLICAIAAPYHTISVFKHLKRVK